MFIGEDVCINVARFDQVLVPFSDMFW
jgi:hypothetical protein